jgi:hypothetical protein
MFKRGTVVQDEQHNIGVVLWDTCPACDYASLCWLTDDLNPEQIESRLEVELTPVADPERYAFEAALALGDTAKALEMYRALQIDQRQAQQLEANARRLQASINVIGQHLGNSTDEVVRELAGEKPYFMPGIITAVQFLVDAHTKLQSALEPFAAYGQIKRLYPDEAVFTIAYDREGNAVKILFSDFTRAAAAHPDARANTHATPTSEGAGGIAEIMEDHRPQTLFGKPIVYTELTDAAKVDGKILRVIPPGEVTINPRFKMPAFGYRVQYVAQDGLTRIGRIGADSDEEALQVFAEMVSGATDLKVAWSIPLTDADGSVW